jgi:hypothetical protein
MAKSKSQKKQSKQRGGDGAADHALKVYGGVNAQHAVSNIDNTIATNGQGVASAGMPAAPAMTGGFWPFGADEQQSSQMGPFVGNNKNKLMDGVVGGKQSKQQLQKTIMKQLKQLKQQGGSLGFSEYSSATQPVSEGMEHATSGSTGSSDIPIVPPVPGQVGGEEQSNPIDLMKGIMKDRLRLYEDSMPAPSTLTGANYR